MSYVKESAIVTQAIRMVGGKGALHLRVGTGEVAARPYGPKVIWEDPDSIPANANASSTTHDLASDELAENAHWDDFVASRGKLPSVSNSP